MEIVYIYISLLRSAKKLKREIENNDKFNKTDYNCFKEKYQKEKKDCIELINMITLGKTGYTKTFSKFLY
jgi:hypothetical protein